MEEIKQKLLEEREAEIQQNVEKSLSGGGVLNATDLPESRFTQLERLQHAAVCNMLSVNFSNMVMSKEIL